MDDEVETRAMLLHAARHAGYGHVCGDCRDVAAGYVRRQRIRWRFVAALLAVAVLVVMCGVVPRADAEVMPPPGSVTISGLDLHDGTVSKVGASFVMVGTRYGCGFQWGVQNTPWCGFGVSTAPDLNGPWSAPQLLFNPNDMSPFSKTSFRALCGSQTGAGCFNPRMVQRSGWGPNDGAWILWFNAPADFARSGANAYYSMGCAGPTGPCGAAGGAFASVTKPSLWSCSDNGDFSIVRDDPRPPMMLCTMRDQTLASERLSYWGASGERGTGRRNLAGVVKAESPGAYRDPSGTWVMTFNELNCGYCAGAPTSYSTSTSIDGVFASPPNANAAWGATALGRRGISATSCGGQARTITVLDGQPYQWIDLWVEGRTQTAARVHLEPLTYLGAAPLGSPHQPFTPWACGT